MHFLLPNQQHQALKAKEDKSSTAKSAFITKLTTHKIKNMLFSNIL